MEEHVPAMEDPLRVGGIDEIDRLVEVGEEISLRVRGARLQAHEYTRRSPRKARSSAGAESGHLGGSCGRQPGRCRTEERGCREPRPGQSMWPLRSWAGPAESAEQRLGDQRSGLDAVGREETAKAAESTHFQDNEPVALRFDQVHPSKKKPEVFGSPKGQLEGGGRR